MTPTLRKFVGQTDAWSATDVLKVRDLSKRFTIHQRNRTLQAFQSVHFTASAGELLALVGASGAGKSSILKCIYRTYLSTSGSVEYKKLDGSVVDLTKISDGEMLELRRSEIRFVSQFLRVVPRRSALQIVESSLKSRRVISNFLPSEHGNAREAAEACLRLVGLPEGLWHLPPNTFSGGEKQLVNLAQALSVKPRLLLLDEPTASLDPASADRILAVMEQLKSPELAMVGVFHDRRIIARIADRQVQLKGGLTLGQFNGETT